MLPFVVLGVPSAHPDSMALCHQLRTIDKVRIGRCEGEICATAMAMLQRLFGRFDAIVNLPRYRKTLWIALIVNAAMFLVEIGAGLIASAAPADQANQRAEGMASGTASRKPRPRR